MGWEITEHLQRQWGPGFNFPAQPLISLYFIVYCHKVQVFQNERIIGAEVARRLRSPTITEHLAVRSWVRSPGPATETWQGNLTRSSDPRYPIGSCGLQWANLLGTVPRCQRVSLFPSLHQTLTIAHMVHDSSY